MIEFLIPLESNRVSVAEKFGGTINGHRVSIPSARASEAESLVYAKKMGVVISVRRA